jgi:S-adenosylmethionine:tRNA ribosyltransferase-isomerase
MNKISLSDFQYHLPEERIAKFPFAQRDQSKLLIYNKSKISETTFYNLPDILNHDNLLVFNDTKVIPARLLFKTETGATIEILLLEPTEKFQPVSMAMEATEEIEWNCMIGGLRKWKDSITLQQKIIIAETEIKLNAILTSRKEQIVKFTWNNKRSFSEILSSVGHVPIPPYLNREDTEQDKTVYQTVFARKEGAVAAPTAALHFTEQVFNKLQEKNIQSEFVTLHVGAGTFLPVKTHDDVAAHPMHAEWFEVSYNFLKRICDSEKKIIAAGTTSTRVLESLYWLGVKLMNEANSTLHVEKLFPYESEKENLPSKKESFGFLLKYLESKKLRTLRASTAIMIMPGYDFKIIHGLITNFHQPGSTLILLVAALIGNDWKKVYEYALQNNFRFLSYGDSSLLLP